MWSFLVVLAFGGVVSGIPEAEPRPKVHQIKVYDAAKTGFFGAPLSSYFEYFDRNEDFKFSTDFFKHYPEEKICEFVAVYQLDEAKVLQGFYIRAENLSDYEDDFFNAVRPFYDYVNSHDLYGLSPLVAHDIAPRYFSSPLRNISFRHYNDVLPERSIPLLFLVPTTDVADDALKDKVLLDDNRFCRTTQHVFHREAEPQTPSDLSEENETSDFTEHKKDTSSDLATEDEKSDQAEHDEPLEHTEKIASSDLAKEYKTPDLTEHEEPLEKTASSDLAKEYKTPDLTEHDELLEKTEKIAPSDLAKEYKTPDLTEHEEPLEKTASSDLAKEYKTPDLAELDIPSDFKDDELPHLEDELFDPIDDEHLSVKPAYGMFMRNDPYFDVFPDHYLRFVPGRYGII